MRRKPVVRTSVAPLSDADLIERLKLLKQHGTIAKAAQSIGLGRSTFSESLKRAKARGLTATSRTVDMQAKLTTKLKVLESELAATRRHNETAESIRQEIYGLAAMTPDPPKWVLGKRIKPGHPGIPVTIWSDFHWGETVSSEETGGQNRFNRSIARTRLKRLVDATIDLCTRHTVKPDYPGIVICLGGDMITGAIHEELQDTNDGYTQQSLLEVQEQLITAIRAMADAFGKVFLPCVVGNHGRATLRPRMKGRVFTSYEWNLYNQLELFFASDKRVQFMIPGEADAHFTVAGHHYLLTHGDALGVKGGDGIIGALGPITRGAIKVGRSEAHSGRDFDTLIMGHWHTYIPRGEATAVIVNGTLKGYDEYARLGLRVPPTRPSQALWFTHPEHGITNQWQVYLEPLKRHGVKTEWVSWQKPDRFTRPGFTLAA